LVNFETNKRASLRRKKSIRVPNGEVDGHLVGAEVRHLQRRGSIGSSLPILFFGGDKGAVSTKSSTVSSQKAKVGTSLVGVDMGFSDKHAHMFLTVK
jgi:hypothetical protein